MAPHNGRGCRHHAGPTSLLIVPRRPIDARRPHSSGSPLRAADPTGRGLVGGDPVGGPHHRVPRWKRTRPPLASEFSPITGRQAQIADSVRSVPTPFRPPSEHAGSSTRPERACHRGRGPRCGRRPVPEGHGGAREETRLRGSDRLGRRPPAAPGGEASRPDKPTQRPTEPPLHRPQASHPRCDRRAVGPPSSCSSRPTA